VKKRNSGLLISLIIGSVISSFYLSGFLDQFELSLGYDTSFLVKNKNQSNKNIKIIGIDQKSLDLIGEYPWRRSLYSDILKYLGNKPKVIGFDIILPEHSNYIKDDLDLAKQIKINNNVVLPISLEPDSEDDSKMNFIYPLDELANSSKGMGLIQYFPDIDGITRKTPKESFINDTSNENSEKIKIFSYEIAKIFLNNNLSNLPEEIYCNFQSKENSYTVYSFYDVISKKIPADTFKNSIVLIGATAEGMQDRISSPMGSMYGVIYHAQLISNILNKDYITPVSKKNNLILIMLVSIFAYLIWKNFETINQLLLITVSVVTLYLFHYLLFNENIWVSIVSIIMANFLTFISLILYEQLKISMSLKVELDNLISSFTKRKLQYKISDSNNLTLGKEIKSNSNRVKKIAEIGNILNIEREFLEALLNNINIPIIVTDEKSNIVLANPSAEIFFEDKNKSRIISKRLVDITDKMPDFQADLIAVHGNEKELPISLNYERGDSVYNIKLLSLDDKLENKNIICMIEDVSNWHQMANRDGLTGLWNQRYFRDYLEKEVNKAKRYKNPLSLIMMDVDNFKSFNDTYGHQTGDIVLKAIAKVLQKNQRNTDIAARYGGEEFSVILTMTDEEGALIFAERVRKQIEQLMIYDINGNLVRQVTASLGISYYNLSTVSDFIESADEALYLCKDNGRNCVIRYSQKDKLIKNEL